MHFVEKWYYVYIMTNRSKTLYTGITGKLPERVFQHKAGLFEGFTSKYKVDRLVHWERFKSVRHALRGKNKLKGGEESRKYN